MGNNLDLSTIFKSVTDQLSQNKDNLNEADSYNHDHGDHMVQIFGLVQNAVSKKADKPISEQLDYASQVVEKEADSGSAKLYAEGLSNAARKFTGKDLNASNMGELVKSLLGADQTPQVEEKPQAKKGLLGSLFSSLKGKSEAGDSDKEIGVDELLRAGMAFYQSKQDGGDNSQAIMQALMAASPMGQSPHRSQSGSLVASTILDFAQSFKK